MYVYVKMYKYSKNLKLLGLEVSIITKNQIKVDRDNNVFNIHRSNNNFNDHTSMSERVSDRIEHINYKIVMNLIIFVLLRSITILKIPLDWAVRLPKLV